MALGIVVVAALALAYVLVMRSLPQLDGRISVVGIDADVTIVRDQVGIPTITGTDRVDVAFATGFAHAQDRFFQMDLSRRNSAGELSALFGSVALDLDKRHRLHRFRARAMATMQGLPNYDKAILDAYTVGVNAGLESLQSKPFEYFVLRSEPVPWRVEDSILAVYSMFLDLNDERARADVRRGIVHNVIPPEVFEWMYPEGTSWDAPIMGVAHQSFRIPDASVYDVSAKQVAVSGTLRLDYPERPLPGSNSWAVSGDLTATGRAIVANDMHLQIKVPNVFYRMRLIVPGETDITGLTLPGMPVIIIGSNGRIAWSFTNSYGDWSDAVIVQAAQEEGSYQTPDGPQQFDVFTETIEVKNAEIETLTVRETIWGPLLDDGSYPDADIAVSWIGHDSFAVNIRQVALEKANTVSEALDIANAMGIPPQNFVCGDADGNIGWTIAGKIPLRSDEYDARLPADWSEQTGWLGWVAPENYPRIVNPESGRIWTANARVADGVALDIIGTGDYALGARAQQIRNRLFAQSSFEPTDMLKIQIDDRAVFLQRWHSLLLDVLDESAVKGDSARQQYRDLVEHWVPRASVDSVGYRLVRAFRLEVRARVFEMLMSPVKERYGSDVKLSISRQFEAPLWDLLNEQPLHLLTPTYESWPGLMLAAVDQNIAYFAETYNSPLADRSWGERNTAAIRHPLSRALPFLSGWLDMPADQMSGDSNMPKAQGPSIGASERSAVSPGDERNAYLHMPTGQSGHPMSQYYRAGHDDWVQARATSFLPGEPTHSLTLTAVDSGR
ncbi:Penicillin acylase II [hydrothermal vent metagenome]|uniref:Penicillin acylase II n=1 Tax=hydrothermal vent metagenome TaxID=652676 RepID=A0A3B0YRR7_9ZZZZ